MYSIYLENRLVSNNLTIDRAYESYDGILEWLEENGYKCLVSIMYDETGEVIEDNGIY